jgi:hypothetical protein
MVKSKPYQSKNSKSDTTSFHGDLSHDQSSLEPKTKALFKVEKKQIWKRESVDEKSEE